MRTNVVYLTSAYLLTGKEAFSKKAVQYLKEFFLEEETCMAPHLAYAQAILGICSGRGIGIIAPLHLADVVFAVERLKTARAGFMLLAGCSLGKKELVELYMEFPVESTAEEARRNIPTRLCMAVTKRVKSLQFP